MKRLIKSIKKSKFETAILAAIVLLAIFLRFYKINELHFFTYDQARDNLIAKRILVDHKWTLLGPQSSMRGVYLPPYYYYTLVPILWLSRLNPVGVDIYTALIGVLTVILVWYFCREVLGQIPALMTSALYATSPLIVELSHRAWNPNTQPLFILLSLFFWYRLWTTKKEKYLLFSSLSFGYATNLHYGALCLLPIWLFAFFWFLVKSKKKRLILFSLLVLFLFGAPLILFDLRHQFMLTKNIYTYFFAGERISLSPKKFFEPMVASVFELFVALLSGTFLKTAQVPFEFWGKAKSILSFAPVSIIAHKPLLVQFQWWGIGLLGVIITAILWFFAKQRGKRGEKHRKASVFLYLIISSIFISALVSRFYIGKFYFFYYIFIYSLPFLFLSFVFWFFWQKKWSRILVFLIFLWMFIFNLRHALIFESPERTINDIQQAAQVITDDVEPGRSFNIAANYRSPDRWDHNAVDYRYFVEAYYGKRALDWQPEDYKKAEVLYVVAEGGLPDPVNTQIMEIYTFEPKKILNTWELPKGVVIYKLGK
ncbi:glycosyltransferase family 39 protein [Patescibacteria group bacterium]|nr:glycosyltransferase family 39 protein [Patescibacteria group bacterium]